MKAVKSLMIVTLIGIIFFYFLPSLPAQAVKFKGPGSPPSRITEVSDEQMNDFLNRLDLRFNQKYSDLIYQIRQAWNSRQIPQYDAAFAALILKIKSDFFGDQRPQPTGGCEQYLGWHSCYCGGPSISCCCVFACNSVPINFCIGVDMGGVIGGGGGGGGGGGMYYICRPIGFTTKR
ncbi:MAG: hypothetical protein N3B16_07205 [Candidatus Aminicenantes bacterium]|nr:hypothetical protein [Candidatus Aminicenantes bacterium]